MKMLTLCHIEFLSSADGVADVCYRKPRKFEGLRDASRHSARRSSQNKKEPQGLFFILERITGLEPATSTLARWRSTK